MGVDLSEKEFVVFLEKARANERSGWEGLYRAYAPQILRYLQLQNYQHSEDILQETFISAGRSIHSFRGCAFDFQKWLFKIAQNQLRSHYRKENRHHAKRDDGLDKIKDLASSEEKPALQDNDQLYQALKVLSVDQRNVVYLHFILDMSLTEIAQVLDKKTGSIRVILHRSLAILRKRSDIFKN